MRVNFKRVSELRLEIIQIDDQVLLVDKTTIELDHWYFNERAKTILRCSHMNIDSIKSMNQKGLHKVCYSTKPLEGLPLLVIEDEVAKWINESTSTLKDVHTINISKMCLNAGYNKAKETYKFTEEDLKKAIDMARKFPANSSYFPLHTTDEIIQFLSKKELWIEVEEKHFRTVKNSEGDVIDHQFTIEPKITNNQIKAVWK